jgi:hypothetical protein
MANRGDLGREVVKVVKVVIGSQFSTHVERVSDKKKM